MSMTIQQWNEYFLTLDEETREKLSLAFNTLHNDVKIVENFRWTGLFTLGSLVDVARLQYKDGLKKKVDYVFIRAWEQRMGSWEHYRENILRQAREENAPERAIYRNVDGTWTTVDEIEVPATSYEVIRLAKLIAEKAMQADKRDSKAIRIVCKNGGLSK